MTRAKTLEEAVRLVADGDRVIVTINGVEVGMIPADEVAEIEAMEDRYLNRLADEALAEPGPNVPLEEVTREREAERANRAKRSLGRVRAER